METKPKFYGYCRASTKGQEYTYEAQRKAITLHYLTKCRETHEWGGWYEDKAVSGGKPFTERPAGMRLWTVIEPGDVIAFAKMDRAFRNTRDASNFLHLCDRKQVGLIFLDIALDSATPLGKFVAHLLASVAELERHWIGQRTREALAARGSRPTKNQPPPGWKVLDDGTPVPDETERQLMEWIVKQHDVHMWSWQMIARYLLEKGVRRPNGTKYLQSWISYALRARKDGYPERGNSRTYYKSKATGKRGGYRPGPKVIRAHRLQSLLADQGVIELSSSPSEDPDQTPDQKP